MTTTATLDFNASADRLGHLGIEKQLAALPGVLSASASPVGLSISVTFDDSRTSVEALRQAVEDCGYHCAGEVLPRHVCAEHGSHEGQAAAGASVHAGHDMASMPGMLPGMAKSAIAHPTAHDEMAHEMGHGSGDMQSMVRDMRNRFWVALVFTIPIFIYSPMGGMFTPPRPALWPAA